jgi:hypothetical protein
MPDENQTPTAELHNVKNENGEFTYVKLPERPADVPEKFWSADHGVNLTALNKGYLNLESSRARFEEETRTRLKNEALSGLPKPPEKYEVAPPKLENAPTSFEYKPDEDPMVKTLMDAGKDIGLTQEAMNKLVERRAQQELEQFQSLGRSTREVLGENAKDRIDKLSRKLTEQLGEAEFNAISAAVSDPHAVVALEKLIGTTTAAPRAGDGAGGNEKLTEADVKSWMADPRYWDPQRRDPRWVKKIEDGWKTLYADEKHDGTPRFTHG